MREIKFRAFDIENKEMFYDIQDSEDFPFYLNPLEGMLKHKVMQYTGLKDKNGKEIYEGDILGNKEVHGDNFYCVVEYGTDGFNGITEPFRNYCRPLHNMMIDGGAEYNEVIGNIYENPELLSKLK